jgi:peroxiredoxin
MAAGFVCVTLHRYADFVEQEIALTGHDNESQYRTVNRLIAPEARGASSRNGLITTLAGPRAGHRVAIMTLLIVASVANARADDQQLRSAHGAKPLFTLSDVHGTEAALTAHRGRNVIVHFFATWCEPCREELPALSRLVARADDRKLSVLAISVAEPPIRVRRFLAETQVNFPVLLDQDRAVAKSWGVDTLPTTFILDADLKPRLAVEREYDWDKLDLANALEKPSRGGD